MDCLFCKINNNEIPSYTIYEDEFVRCFLDINPISDGHTLIIPKKHFTDINDIDLKYLCKIQEVSKRIVKLLNDKLKPDGIKLVQNNGVLQEVKHYHLHVIPHYNKNKKNKVEDIYKIIVKN